MSLPKKFWVGIFLFLIPISASATSYRSLAPGLEYAVKTLKPDSVKLHILRVDPNQYRVKPILAKQHQKVAMNAKQMASSAQALAVINANFFDKDKKPLGLVLIDGKIFNPIHPTRWWATWVSNAKGSRIEKIFNAARLKGEQQAIQAGPRLVIRSQVPKLKEETSAKSALGIDSRGRMLLMATEGQISITQLAKVLSQSPRQDGLGLPNVLNLDGGSSTQFFIRVNDFELNLPSLIKVPVGLGVFKKE